MNNIDLDLRFTLVNAARQFYQLGWMVGTAGNLSVRNSDNSFWISASGKNKGLLAEEDFVRLNLEGKVLEVGHPSNKPSAETSIHQVIYSLFPKAQACYHVHSVQANLVSNFSEGDILTLPPLEMLKGMGVWQEQPKVTMPIFENYLEVPRIAEEISDRFTDNPPDIPALLIRNHGVTVWATSPMAAQNMVEIVEYIFRYLVAARQSGIWNQLILN
jgi:methylthioribulose-1-phosphate dehydratase